MIKIDIWSNALIVKGHANAGAYGQDIVCAGVSAIVLGALNWFDANDCHLEMKDGFISLICQTNHHKYNLYFKLLQKQLLALKSNDHLSLKIHKGKYNEI